MRLFVLLLMAVALLASAAAAGPKQGLTIVPVTIDPLGAEGEVPWIVHASRGLNVRAAPTTNAASIGMLPVNSTIAGVYNLVVESDEEWLSFPWNGQTGYSSLTGMTRPHPRNVARIAELGNLPYGTELVNRWWAVPISYEPNDLISMPSRYGLNGTQYRLRREAAEAVMAMIEAAAADGVTMLVMSAYRSGPSQKSIYDNNVSNSGLAQRFSAPPGTASTSWAPRWTSPRPQRAPSSRATRPSMSGWWRAAPNSACARATPSSTRPRRATSRKRGTGATGAPRRGRAGCWSNPQP